MEDLSHPTNLLTVSIACRVLLPANISQKKKTERLMRGAFLIAI